MEFGNASLNSQISDFAFGFLPLFYIVPPHLTYFEKISQVPKYVQDSVGYFIILILIEAVILWFKRRRVLRLNDALGSLTAGLVMQIVQDIILRGFEVSVYVWIHNNYCLFQLPWDSPVTWWVCFIGYDFGYYWFHRMAHEVNLFWAAHQVHHSSEEYNLTTALRQSALQKFTSWFFFMPMALCIPPTQYIVHKEFNLLYQFWIHTEVVDRLGPLEYVLNTPSHHRVHHGRNRYCIDKNYAGVFIFWDVLFGTFTPEGDKIYYGLVHPLGTFNPITVQLHHLEYILKSLWNAEGISKRVSILFKGPGWSPGTPRLGNPEDIPEIPEVTTPYHKRVPWWYHVYCVSHFTIVVISTLFLDAKQAEMSYVSSLMVVFLLFFCLTNIGMIYDKNSLAPKLECMRLLLLLGIDQFMQPHFLHSSVPTLILRGVQVFHLFSLLVWSSVCFKQINQSSKKED